MTEAVGVMNASRFELKALMGRRVRSLREFADVPVGREGVVDEVYGDKRHSGVMVAWDPKPGEEDRRFPLRDGFGRDEDDDETAWLEVI